MTGPIERSELEKTLADKIPARLAGAAIGAMIGGPVGAVATAVSSPLIEYVLSTGNQRYIDGAQDVAAGVAAELGMTPDDLRDHVAADNERLAVTTETVRVALDTLDRRKIAALTRVLSYGLGDDARLEMSAVYVRALRNLESFHVRVLTDLSSRTVISPKSAWTVRFEPAVETIEFRNDHARLGAGLTQVLAVLRREGLIEDFEEETAMMPLHHGLRITDFGREVLAWLLQPDAE